MSTEKKIGFRLYPNTRLKPQKIFSNDEVIESYPLYATVTFNGESIQLRILLDSGPVFTMSDISRIKDVETTEKITRYQHFVSNVIRLEYKFLKSNFALKGLGTRLEVYKKKVLSYISDMTIRDLQEYIEYLGGGTDGDKSFFDEESFARAYFLGAKDLYGEMDVVEFLYKGGREHYLSAVDYDEGYQKNLKGLSIILDYEIQKELFGKRVLNV